MRNYDDGKYLGITLVDARLIWGKVICFERACVCVCACACACACARARVMTLSKRLNARTTIDSKLTITVLPRLKLAGAK